MATGPKGVCRELKTLFHLGVVGTLSDAQLLEEFLASRGDAAEDAFAAVVERHGPMVLRVCRRILTEPHDAEDAFQVTFLVLARKARTIARREQLTNWLYGVAVRTAKEVRKSSARRRAREGRVDEMVRTASPREEDVDELRLVIDDELSRLPESFRAPVVLCDLEGKTQKEAAQLLGVPVGTVSSRLSRGRNLLRQRLTRRGLAPPGAELATEPFRDETPTVVPPALVACTSRAAAQFVIQGTLAGTVAAHLATITEGVLKAMLIAKLTSKGIVVSAILFLSIGAAAVGIVAYAQRRAEPTIGPEQFGSGRAADDWSWIDRLKNADEATKERLKRCARSATENFAAIRRLIFDYDLVREFGHTDESSKTTNVISAQYHGTVYWRDGSVRYDFDGLYPMHKIVKNGLVFIMKKPKVYSVVRSWEMLAYTEENPVYGLWLTVMKPPQSVGDWENQSFAPLRHLDPWLYYAGPFCSDTKMMREVWEDCRAIESEEKGGKVLLRFIHNNVNNGRGEVTCDQSADWLPVQLRAGDVRDGEWVVIVDLSTEWKKSSGVWYPSHFVKTAYWSNRRPVKELDLTVRNLRANGAANVPESLFTLSGMRVADGTPGLDTRNDSPRGLIRAGGVVRQSRPGEGPIPKTVQQIEREQAKAAIPSGDQGISRPEDGPTETPGKAESSLANHEYLSLLDEYASAHKDGEKAIVEAKTEQKQQAAFVALGRLEWSYASRFLALAQKYPGEPVAIDALGGLVANRFNPPEAEQAAEILIRDHIKSDKLISLYRQLGRSSSPWSTAAERLFRAAAEYGPTPDARGQACLSLGYLLVNRAGDLRKLRGPDPDPLMKVEELARSGGREPVIRSDEDPDALSKEAERFFDRVVEQYAGIAGKSGKLGEAAEKELFRLRQLAVGRPAPDVEGEDVDGKRFRLSDYRGKVVVLTFSGNWCGPCRAMYPHERELVERMKGRPFELLSVNTDEDKATLRRSLASGEITWRCWWEGGHERPNCVRWQQDSFPIVYVIDSEGVIRAKDVRGKAIDAAVDPLVGQLESLTNATP